MNHLIRKCVFSSVMLTVLWQSHAFVEGALAIGLTGDIAKDGYSIGSAVNYATKEEARAQALDKCRSNGGPTTKQNCKIVINYSRQCFVEASDPQPGTPGAGWAINPDWQLLIAQLRLEKIGVVFARLSPHIVTRTTRQMHFLSDARRAEKEPDVSFLARRVASDALADV